MPFRAAGGDYKDDVPPDCASVPSDPPGVDAIDPGDLFDPPDALDHVVEVADMRASLAAQQLVRVDAMLRQCSSRPLMASVEPFLVPGTPVLVW